MQRLVISLNRLRIYLELTIAKYDTILVQVVMGSPGRAVVLWFCINQNLVGRDTAYLNSIDRTVSSRPIDDC